MTRFRCHSHPLKLTLQRLAPLAFLLLLHSQTLGLLVEPTAIVALPGDAFAAVEFKNPTGNIVKEIAVVRDGNDSAFVLLKVVLEPFNALGVEVVGRLVKQQYVRLLQQQTAQGHTAALTAAEVLDKLVLVGATQGVHSAFQAAVEVPGIVLLQQFGQFALTLAQFIEVGIRLRKGIVHLLIFFHPVNYILHSLLHHFLHCLAVIELGLLLKIADTVAWRKHHLALVVLVYAGNDFQQA